MTKSELYEVLVQHCLQHNLPLPPATDEEVDAVAVMAELHTLLPKLRPMQLNAVLGVVRCFFPPEEGTQ